VVIHRIDCTTGKEFGKPWVVDVKEAEMGNQPYDKARLLREARPEFAKDAKLSAVVTENAVTLTVDQKFANDVLTVYYMVSLTANDGARTQRRYFTDFWQLVHDEPIAETLSLKIGDLKPGFYEAKVVPMNGVFGEGERALRCGFTIEA